ncbi:glycyl-radical enzyme activating protein [Pectobacterium parmentieri]|uniref:glycyl-radical enzyme activating protein n=1 Tax=Pectobacterium parmentieri TaxID=1905730 RepID=UPI000CDD0961|nr:glycyl-radical enzyme activating protein [Pectobacterium parmentieri]AYH06886.1 glycyl-radical enzyme activating protein [Pectobacterium parmentieri]AYH15697.1 glycyl-radical enzyme activating protein [Pectobacterium parmentieri]AYH24406.1 glycyl-radical enzyme activating protein [Pectobacterium parmentieri]MBN3179278.1 glycyl-radical enzyme activating protein [Pectobacterium parmentieri]POW24864.1 pyruvate formate lyase-activating protein [Pectobacterium parmentieri]
MLRENNCGAAELSAMNKSLLHSEILTGWVFNTQRYSLHDGVGIRTVVFLKGCPLRCEWCSNPESQSGKPEIAVDVRKCLGGTICGLCESQCQTAALSYTPTGEICLDRHLCSNCLTCTTHCPTQALHGFGEPMTVRQVLDIVESDSIFYRRSGGGLTLSGGEPLMQGMFALALLQEAKRRHIGTLLETCGDGHWSDLCQIANYTDAIYFDVKSMNDVQHRRFTRRGNHRILNNLLQLRQAFPNLPIHVRTPLIPRFNANWHDIQAIIDFILPLSQVSYEILPYHRLGRDKYRLLGRDYLPAEQLLCDEVGADIIQQAKTRCGERYGAPMA